MAEGLRESVLIPGLSLRVGKRWLGPIPCAAFCIASGGLHGGYALFEDNVVGHDASLDVPFSNAHGWRLGAMNFAIVFAAILLLRYPTRTRTLGLLGFMLNTGHAVVAFGVQGSQPSLLYLGCAIIGLGVGTLYAVGVKLLLAWIPESQWMPAMIALLSYALGYFMSEYTFPFLLHYLHVVPCMYTLALILVMVGVLISEDCRLPTDVHDDRNSEIGSDKAASSEVDEVEGQKSAQGGPWADHHVSTSSGFQARPTLQSTTFHYSRNAAANDQSSFYSSSSRQPLSYPDATTFEQSLPPSYAYRGGQERPQSQFYADAPPMGRGLAQEQVSRRGNWQQASSWNHPPQGYYQEPYYTSEGINDSNGGAGRNTRTPEDEQQRWSSGAAYHTAKPPLPPQERPVYATQLDRGGMQ